MENRKKNVFIRQDYEPPRTEAIAVAQESILCASPSDIDGGLEEFINGVGAWDGLGGGPESMTTTEGSWGN